MKIFTDGGARGNPGPAAAAFVARDEEGKILAKKGKLLGVTTNNVAEYQAVILAWNWLVRNYQLRIANCEFFLDSLLVVNQLNGKFKIKKRKLQELAGEIKRLEREAGIGANYTYIPREKNFLADKLVSQLLDNL